MLDRYILYRRTPLALNVSGINDFESRYFKTNLES